MNIMINSLEMISKGYIIALVENETEKSIMMMAECNSNRKRWYVPVWFPKSICKNIGNSWYIPESYLHKKIKEISIKYNHHVCVELATAQYM